MFEVFQRCNADVLMICLSNKKKKNILGRAASQPNKVAQKLNYITKRNYCSEQMFQELSF